MAPRSNSISIRQSPLPRERPMPQWRITNDGYTGKKDKPPHGSGPYSAQPCLMSNQAPRHPRSGHTRAVVRRNPVSDLRLPRSLGDTTCCGDHRACCKGGNYKPGQVKTTRRDRQVRGGLCKQAGLERLACSALVSWCTLLPVHKAARRDIKLK